jgi:glycine oxidase
MNAQQSVDYIIVGQGIAGTVLAQTLLSKGQQVMVIDDGYRSSSSVIAAGLYNPIVFKRLTKSWMADELLEVADRFYPEMEQLLGEQFYHRKEILRFFANVEDQNNWSVKSDVPGFETYLSDDEFEAIDTQKVKMPFAYGAVKNAGYLNMSKLMNSFRNHMADKGFLVEETFDYAALTHDENGVYYKDIKAAGVIFCEGYKAVENPWFSKLPFVLTKGEVLTIRAKQLKVHQILNKGFFVLPLADDCYRVGATFDWKNLDVQTTVLAKTQLTEKLEGLLNIPFEIIDQKAGIRPTVKDRRPMLGKHAEFSRLSVFNGMGTKGVMLAPYFAEHFCNHLLENEMLSSEVDIKRFSK